MSGFGEILREARIRARLTQKELAKIVPADHTYISKMEKGLFLPTRKLALGLAEALGITEKHARNNFLLAAGVLNQEDVQGFALVETAGTGTAGGLQPTADQKFEELKAEVRELKSEVTEVKEVVKELSSSVWVPAPPVSSLVEQSSWERQMVKNVIKAVGEANVKSALEQFVNKPCYELYPYWRQHPAAAQKWDRIITEEEEKEGKLYLVLKGFPSITVPKTQYLNQIGPLLRMRQWKDLTKNIIDQRDKRWEAFLKRIETQEFIHIMPKSTVEWYAKEKYPAPDAWSRLLGGPEATPQQIADHILFIVDLMENSKNKYKVGLLDNHPADELKLYDNVHWEVKVGHAVLMENFLSGKEQDLRITEPSIVAAFELFFRKEMWENFAITSQDYVMRWLTEEAYKIDPTCATRHASRAYAV